MIHILCRNDENPLNALNSNMKRESKVYSYKEQQEELALRRELLEKKKRAGKIVEPQYTPKQIEAIKAQHEKEGAIRNKLKELHTTLINTISIIKASAKGNQDEICIYFRDLIPSVLQSLQSPLAAPLLTNLFIDLHKVVFTPTLHPLGDLISHVTLRLLKPACDLNPAWEEESVTEAVIRTINEIHTHVLCYKDAEINPEIPQRKSDNFRHLTAPMISFLFPFLKTALLSPEIKSNDQVLHDALQIISEHAKLRGGKVLENGKDMYHPRLLPHKQMFELLVELISSTSARIQSQAVACLLDVARSCGATDEFCAKATEVEWSVLLGALQNPSSSVRDAALRALEFMVATIPTPKESKELCANIVRRVWIAKFDNEEDIR